MVRVARVHPESIAAELGIAPGTELVSVNGRELSDFLDWEFLTAEDALEVEAVLPDGDSVVYEIERPEGEQLGVELEPPSVRRCANRCEFCFIEGLPKGLRKNLYIRDDDYRLSFAYGNFATLSNMKEKDEARIIEYRLSPLYVSVHATPWEARKVLLNNPRVPDIKEQLWRLVEGGIQFHGQMVVVPGLNDGDVLAIDGGSGLVVLEPDAADLRGHHRRVAEVKRERRQLNRLRREPTPTLDGAHIKLSANAESRNDVTEAHALGAAGVGLYRTEFLFLGSSELPDEEAQFRAYRDAVLAMTGRTVTIRTLDLGADKADKTGLALRNEPNPALGLRGVRLSLARSGLLHTQLRAIARASGYGPLRVLVPMVSGGEEVRAVRHALDEVLRELRAEGREIAAQIPLGAMIEVPSAALALPTFVGLCDFLSIGTNDLVQYLLAADRTNEALDGLYSPLHPAVLRVLRDVVRPGQRRGMPVTVCGEIAADPAFVPMLLALGLTELSLHPATLLDVRRTIRACDLGQLRAAAPALLRARNRSGIERWLQANPAG